MSLWVSHSLSLSNFNETIVLFKIEKLFVGAVVTVPFMFTPEKCTQRNNSFPKVNSLIGFFYRFGFLNSTKMYLYWNVYVYDPLIIGRIKKWYLLYRYCLLVWENMVMQKAIKGRTGSHLYEFFTSYCARWTELGRKGRGCLKKFKSTPRLLFSFFRLHISSRVSWGLGLRQKN